ncbi:(2Fe-2S)-binding protein [Pseudorhodoferax soli]|uniref:Xanthine dehydrogenase YagT iron-sulfur-binding subunit n=1 Tax=Pseudorhodoferax soli TaxID=545864 RepID=A0A368XZD1_9BURK|nr:(2Fe-2S)-binding protein [Pseudorhodoferax soli]RCW72506.1 xanthine dehydrogenase YagT iron-sulfur-binding subunit [Pseudorhodoferax soli]
MHSDDQASAPAGQPLALRVNGQPRSLVLQPWVSLLDMLRDRLQLTGTKKGCDHGQCGACTVLVDGRRELSCLALARAGCDIVTVEGLADGERLSPLQQAFIRHDALQCGYCTPGQLCSAEGLLREGQARTLDEVRELMSGNLCRCGAYVQIAQAVAEVAFGPGPHASERADRPIVTGTVPG